MSHAKPFHRTYRDFAPSSNAAYSQRAFVLDRQYAQSPEHYVRAFMLIQKDLQTLFEFIEPSDTNLTAYSYRTHELLIRTCIEIEANFKAILNENTFNPIDKNGHPRRENRWNIHDYKKVNKTHHLASYRVHIPIWEGSRGVFEPFRAWSSSVELSWYQAYNESKHDRRAQFKQANFENLLISVAGLLVVLSSQFGTQDFSPQDEAITSGDGYYSTTPALGGFFHIEFPNDWSDDEIYDFNWDELRKEANRFQRIDYDHI